MKKRVLLALYFTAISLLALLTVSALGKGNRLNAAGAFDRISALTENASGRQESLRFLSGERARFLLSFFLIAAVPSAVFLSGFTVFSVSFTTVSAFVLSLGAAASLFSDGSDAKTLLLASLALAGTILTGVYSAEHRSVIRYAAPDVKRMLKRPETKRYVKSFLSVCSFLFLLTAAITILPLP